MSSPTRLLPAPGDPAGSDTAAVADDVLDVLVDARSQSLKAQLSRVSASEANVLILGERGTGKEDIAQQIHRASQRRSQAFRAVNCGAFPPGQVESELFGHERGAVAGAFVARAGWIESAHGGTLFLDEVDQLAPPQQVRLLKVLRDRELLRMGARRALPVDVRLLAATSVDLEAAVRAGRFRADLYFALRVAHLTVPALRERAGDILPLARHYLAAYRRRMGYSATTLSRDAEARLQAHDWPGNLRELENVIHHALVFSSGALITGEAISLSTLAPAAGQCAASGSAPDTAQQLAALLDRLCAEAPDGLFKQVERSAMLAAYRHCRGNQVKAARLLGVSRNVLRARLIEYSQISAAR